MGIKINKERETAKLSTSVCSVRTQDIEIFHGAKDEDNNKNEMQNKYALPATWRTCLAKVAHKRSYFLDQPKYKIQKKGRK